MLHTALIFIIGLAFGGIVGFVIAVGVSIRESLRNAPHETYEVHHHLTVPPKHRRKRGSGVTKKVQPYHAPQWGGWDRF